MLTVQDTASPGIAAPSPISSLLPHFKSTTTPRGLTYAYFFSPPSPGAPTLLLIHGFPSLAVDWHPQITYFKARGYGVIAPDMLGYGGTDKPRESAAYVGSLVARDVVWIVEREGVGEVVVVGHDWGCKTVSVLANLYEDRFIGFGFLAAGYLPPGTTVVGMKKLREQSIALFGYETFGYWEFFTSPDAPTLIASHFPSFMDIVYAQDPRISKFNAGPEGAIRVFLESDTRTPRLPSFTEEQVEYHKEVFGKYGMEGPSNYYRVSLNGEAAEDDERIPTKNHTISKPVFFGSARRDVICVDWFNEALTRKFAKNVTVVGFDAGHWVAAEAAGEVNEALRGWVEGFGGV